jgi:ribonuclease E
LNEKRADIHRIESRLKVNITLIPNPHMETPHYSVNRLRPDDITSEHLKASYKMVEKPEEVKVATAASAEETKAQRPQAAVKGITPAQPAPKREEKKAESASLFSKLFGWLLGSGEESKPAEPVKARPQHPRRERDGNRDGNRQRNKPRRDRDDTNAPRAENAQPNKGQPQEPRGERQPRPPRPTPAEKPVLETSKPVIANEQNGEETSNTGQGRKRGRRGGRRERERREELNGGQPANKEANSANAPANIPQDDVVPVQSTPVEAKQTEVIIEQPVQIAPMPVAEVVVAAVVAPVEAITVVATAVEPEVVAVATEVEMAPAQPIAAPDLNAAGLVMIETDPNKAASVVVPQETSAPAPRRRARPREIYTATNNEPLVMIETQKK